jgi:hypothetical protein
MVRTAASISAAVRSGHFCCATSSSCARVTLPTLLVFGVAGALGDTRDLAQQHRRRRRLLDEGEGAIAVHRDDHGNRQTGLRALGLGVERLAELHDVHAMLTQRRAHGGLGLAWPAGT